VCLEHLNLAGVEIWRDRFLCLIEVRDVVVGFCCVLAVKKKVTVCLAYMHRGIWKRDLPIVDESSHVVIVHMREQDVRYLIRAHPGHCQALQQLSTEALAEHVA